MDGSLDTTFGSGGTALVDFGGGLVSTANSLAQQADGKLVAVGLVLGDGLDMGLMRLTANGLLDPMFDGDGRLAVDFDGNADAANAVVIQPDGAIVVAGYSEPTDGSGEFDSALLRVIVDGSLDSAFGVGGQISRRSGGSSKPSGFNCGPIGQLTCGHGFSTDSGDEIGVDMIVVRFISDGTLDLTFRVEGVATADFGYGELFPPLRASQSSSRPTGN